MSLEAATFIADLVKSNPLGSDKKSQGDDHIRLIKTVLQNTFPNANKPFTASKGMTKTAAYTVVAGDDKTVISVDTSAGLFNLTLPVLTTADAGWSIDVIKINTGVNPVFLVPSAGTINGFAYVRRTLEYLITRVIWNGGNFYASRPNGGSVGELRYFSGPNLPNDCLWPDGQAFPAGNYPELNAALGGATKPDLRGVVAAGRDNMGAGTRGFIGALQTDSGVIVGTTLWSTGGIQSHAQTGAELFQHSHTIDVSPSSHDHGWGYGTQSMSPGGFGTVDPSRADQSTNRTSGVTISASARAAGSSVGMAMLQPTIMMNVGLVAE